MTLATFPSEKLISSGALRLDLLVQALATKVAFVGVSRRTRGIFNRTSDDTAITNASFAVVVKRSHNFWLLGASCEYHRFTVDKQTVAVEEKQGRQRDEEGLSCGKYHG